MKRRARVIGVIVLGVFGLSALLAQSIGAQEVGASGRQPFHVTWEAYELPRGGSVIKGYVENPSPWPLTNVDLRVEALASDGTVIDEVFGSVLGDVPAGRGAYFLVPFIATASTYRISVASYDGLAVSVPPSASP